MPVLGFWDLLILLFLALLVFGPKRLPTMGRSLGSSMRGFRDAITDRHERMEQKALPPADSERDETEAPVEAPVEAPARKPTQREHDTVL
jgi:sec-independent protein translocase protein TatA